VTPETELVPNPKSPIPGSAYLRTGANGLITALLAPSCAVCDAILDDPLSGSVCAHCWAAVRHITPPLCDVCGDPLPRVADRCLPCSYNRRIVDFSRSVGEYEGVLREIIHAFKYTGRRSLAPSLAALMSCRGNTLLERADYLVPVPLHWRREHHRGFNQARELACHLGRPLLDALVRNRYTRPQVELAADRRHANVHGAFKMRRRWFRLPPSIEGAKVLLVDDVSTTGATLEACAKVLKAAGASQVYALTAARVVTRPAASRPRQ
jgi:ComF family protein